MANFRNWLSRRFFRKFRVFGNSEIWGNREGVPRPKTTTVFPPISKPENFEIFPGKIFSFAINEKSYRFFIFAKLKIFRGENFKILGFEIGGNTVVVLGRARSPPLQSGCKIFKNFNF